MEELLRNEKRPPLRLPAAPRKQGAEFAPLFPPSAAVLSLSGFCSGNPEKAPLFPAPIVFSFSSNPCPSRKVFWNCFLNLFPIFSNFFYSLSKKKKFTADINEGLPAGFPAGRPSSEHTQPLFDDAMPVPALFRNRPRHFRRSFLRQTDCLSPTPSPRDIRRFPPHSSRRKRFLPPGNLQSRTEQISFADTRNTPRYRPRRRFPNSLHIPEDPPLS